MRIVLLIFMLLAQSSLAAEKSPSLSTFFDPAPHRQREIKPAEAQLPDLSKAPKWHDVAAKPEFQALPPEKQAEAKSAYFDYWIAPHAAADGINVEQARANFLTLVANTPAAPVTPQNPNSVAEIQSSPAPTASTGNLTLHATLLQVLAFGIAWSIGFILNRPSPKLWRQIVGFLLGVAIGGPLVIAAWAYGMDTLMPTIPGAFKQIIPTVMGKAVWSAVLGAGLGVYFGRQKTRNQIVASTPTMPPASAQTLPVAARLRAIKLPAISLEQALLGIIAATTLAIAASYGWLLLRSPTRISMRWKRWKSAVPTRRSWMKSAMNCAAAFRGCGLSGNSGHATSLQASPVFARTAAGPGPDVRHRHRDGESVGAWLAEDGQGTDRLRRISGCAQGTRTRGNPGKAGTGLESSIELGEIAGVRTVPASACCLVGHG